MEKGAGWLMLEDMLVCWCGVRGFEEGVGKGYGCWVRDAGMSSGWIWGWILIEL